MTTHPYRTAFDAAMSELTEIAAKFEQLRARKGQIETVIAALQAIFEPENGTRNSPQTGAASDAKDAADDKSEEQDPGGYSYLDVPTPLPESDGDPFERRVKTTFRFRGLAAQRSL